MMSADDQGQNRYISQELQLPENNDYFSDDSAFESALEKIRESGWEEPFLEEAIRRYHLQGWMNAQYGSIEEFGKSGEKREWKVSVIVGFLRKIRHN